MDEITIKSPQITHISWGKMEIEGVGSGKDFKLYPGGGREWDWGEHGTRHSPGILPADVEELLEHGSKVIILSRGIELRLKTAPETLELLKDQGIKVYIEETIEAVEIYNELAEQAHSVHG